MDNVTKAVRNKTNLTWDTGQIEFTIPAGMKDSEFYDIVKRIDKAILKTPTEKIDSMFATKAYQQTGDDIIREKSWRLAHEYVFAVHPKDHPTRLQETLNIAQLIFDYLSFKNGI